jgi:hypothetical protein
VIAPDRAYEFVCCECGQSVVAFIKTNDFCLCATCIMLPGWHRDPTLRRRLGPLLPPLPDDGEGCAQ